MKQSKELTAFYRAYYDWVSSGALNGQPFYRDRSLCYNVDYMPGLSSSAKFSIEDEMDKQFSDSGLWPIYPFNEDENSFSQERRNGSYHENPARIAWVKAHLNSEGK